jgi:4-carboxymuconolactone decarboxylase
VSGFRRHGGAGAREVTLEQTSMSKPYIPPLPQELWTDDARNVFAFWEGEKARNEGPAYSNALIFAQNPALAMAYLPFSKYLLEDASLAPRLREIAIVRVNCIRRSDYQMAHHLELAAKVGVAREEMLAIKEGPDAPVWSELESHLIRAVDQIMLEGTIRPESWTVLSAHLSYAQLLDLIFTVGNYAMLVAFMNVSQLELEPQFEPYTNII